VAGRPNPGQRRTAAVDGRHRDRLRQSTTTTHRSNLFGWAGYGYESAHSRWYWGVKLLLITTADGTVTGFSLANPKLAGERDQTRHTLTHRPVNRPEPGTTVVTDKGLSGAEVDDFFTGLELTLIRPARRDEKTHDPSRAGCGNASKRSSGP
jgi:hypothetical protein